MEFADCDHAESKWLCERCVNAVIDNLKKEINWLRPALENVELERIKACRELEWKESNKMTTIAERPTTQEEQLLGKIATLQEGISHRNERIIALSEEVSQMRELLKDFQKQIEIQGTSNIEVLKELDAFKTRNLALEHALASYACGNASPDLARSLIEIHIANPERKDDLTAIMNALAESVAEASNEEILEEARAQGEDPTQMAQDTRDVLARHLARALIALERKKDE